MIVALLRRSIRRARGLLLALTAVLTAFQVLVVAAAAYLDQHRGFSSLAAFLPPFVQQALGGVFSSFGAMVSFGYFHPIVVIVFVGVAIVVASEPAGDIESGVVDLILARPVRRPHLISRSALMLGLTTLTIAAVMAAASWSAMRLWAPPGAAVRLTTLLRLASNLVAVAWAVGAMALAAAARARRRGAAAGGVAIVALGLYVLNFLADLWPRLRPYGPLSPFHYYQPIGIVTGVGSRWLPDVLLLAGAGAVLCAIAYVVFARRDV
jgi:ABC-2 type transport system permease protein